MSKGEYIKQVNKCEINKERIRKISEKYGVEIEGVIAKAVSYADSETFFDDERRALEFSEITNPSSFGKTLLDEKAIPVVDVYDGMYAVYLIKEDKWALYSSADGSIFKKRDSLDDVI